MVSKIFVNLSVKNVKRSIEFFTKLGFSFNMQFTNDDAACLILGENIFTMLLSEAHFRQFTKKEISDASKSTEVLIAIEVESKEKVEELINKAVEAGGRNYREPADYGWMYQHSFEDLDGHQWEVLYIAEVPQQ